MKISGFIYSIIKNKDKNIASNNIADVKNVKSQQQEAKTPVNPQYYSEVLGISQKKSQSSISANLFKSLDNIANKNSDFCNMDIQNSNFHFNLEYSRDDFIKDVNSLTSNLSTNEKNLVCDYFGFELHDGPFITMTGFPKTPLNNEKDNKTFPSEIGLIVKNLQSLVDKFTSDNQIVSDGNVVTEQAAKDINSILKVFPELFSIIGNRQHYSHDFTLDVHTFSVLQECIKNPKFTELSPEDKQILMLSAIFHDIEKTENTADSNHPLNSAKKASELVDRIAVSNSDKEKIHKLIKNHNLLEICNKAAFTNKQENLIDFYANELKDGNLLEMEQILTKADLLCVKEDAKSFYKYQDAYNSIFAKLFDTREK